MFAAVRVLAESVSTLPAHVYRRLGDERQQVTGGPLAELVQPPSPAQTTAGLLGTVMVALLVHGNAYVGL